MSKEQDQLFVVCVRIRDMPVPYIDSDLRQCALCGATVWSSPASLEFVEQHPTAKILCPKCALKKATPSSTFLMTEKQMEELKQIFKSKGNM